MESSNHIAASAIAKVRPSRRSDSGEVFLELANLTKTYGNLAVIKDISLKINRGEFVSLLGPSGCGKTTTLRMIAGFVSCDQGEIRLGGERIDKLPTDRRGATMVFQNYALFPHMTVAENVAFGLRVQRTSKPEIVRRVDEVLSLVQLSGLQKRYPKELSGGQQQRVALARAIVLKPKVLLLDEPLSNLDAKLRKELRQDFVDIHRISGITTVFVTHDLEEAFSISDRVAVMNQGVVEQFDTPANIFLKPRTGFVSEFVGHSNVISGWVREAPGNGRVLSVGEAEFAAPAELPVGAQARFAIPIHLIHVTTAPVPSDVCLPARIVSLRYLGASIQIDSNVAGTALHIEIPASAASFHLREGDDVFVSWQTDSLILLPQD